MPIPDGHASPVAARSMMGRPPIVITGCGGWIGSALIGWLGTVGAPERLADLRLFGSAARTITAPGGARLSVRQLTELGPADVRGAIVLHLAYLTREKVAEMGVAAFVETNLAIDDHVLSAITLESPVGIFIASSGAAREAAEGHDRNPYGISKLMQEARFLEWGARAGRPVLAGRIFNIAGPGMNKLDSYALGSFLSQGLSKRRIEIAATVPVYRSYLHVQDLCALVMAVLECGDAPDMPVDLCGSQLVEMADVAREAARASDLAPDRILRGPIDHAHPSIYFGNPVHTRAIALRHGLSLSPFDRQVDDTARYICDQMASSKDRSPDLVVALDGSRG